MKKTVGNKKKTNKLRLHVKNERNLQTYITDKQAYLSVVCLQAYLSVFYETSVLEEC
jgi:hypothetical protein